MKVVSDLAERQDLYIDCFKIPKHGDEASANPDL